MYQSMILKVPNLFTTKCAYASISSHTAQCLVSYQGECELSKLCWNNGFLVRWLYIVITCDAWASTFSPYHDTLALWKGLVRRGIYSCIMKQVYCIPPLKAKFHILHPIGAYNLALMCLLDICLLPCDVKKFMWGLFWTSSIFSTLFWWPWSQWEVKSEGVW